MDIQTPWVLWSSELSPFALKIELMLKQAGLPYEWQPSTGGLIKVHKLNRRLRQLRAGKQNLTWPKKTVLDEYPAVPFLFGPDGENLYDSTAIGDWLHQHYEQCQCLLASGNPVVDFVIRLIDEAMDEVGLYLVHHHRWAIAARDNTAGMRLSREMRLLMGPMALVLRKAFPARQVRRMPYLFSVADTAAGQYADLPADRQPPSREKFPPTHQFLEGSYGQLLASLEPILSSREFLFGEAITLADASVYGQIAMNMSDPAAWKMIQGKAPHTASWIQRLNSGKNFANKTSAIKLHTDLVPVLKWVCDFFVPLMQQNFSAYQQHLEIRESMYNEKAFNRNRALYRGHLGRVPFTSVAKTFQVRVWQDLRNRWDNLSPAHIQQLETLLPAEHGLNKDTRQVRINL